MNQFEITESNVKNILTKSQHYDNIILIKTTVQALKDQRSYITVKGFDGLWHRLTAVGDGLHFTDQIINY